ncbi:hypothetical protein ACQKF0_29470 [Bacillus wiedmannii]|uniref:hypothetical protein n=1 Tax=Bacillus wiedmannii TaxID=1890302 RepID=UPI003CFC14D9
MKRLLEHLTNMELDKMYWEANKEFMSMFHVKEIREQAYEKKQIASEEIRYRHENNLM